MSSLRKPTTGARTQRTRLTAHERSTAGLHTELARNTGSSFSRSSEKLSTITISKQGEIDASGLRSLQRRRMSNRTRGSSPVTAVPAPQIGHRSVGSTPIPQSSALKFLESASLRGETEARGIREGAFK